MKLSELPKEQLRVGIKLISAIGKSGEIIGIDKDAREDWDIWIRWEDGSEDVVWHFWGHSVDVVEES